MEDCLLWVGPHAGAGEECEEEGAAQTTHDELTATPIPCPLVPLVGEQVEKIGSEVEAEKKGGTCKGHEDSQDYSTYRFTKGK
ncbi:hypothetical protein QYF61_011059 [Mycteria americana]|uniref:Uncharacterized protein n=1 Tax=Mycteria americana TaxID=33587 RepID=A0AAN7NQG8_MYCAM|nr:hypothetical protein QYF61_011059 [Mycteria americana]